MAGESGNFLLKFIADMTQVEKELSALESRGKSAAARAQAKSAAPASRGTAFTNAIQGLDTAGLDPRAAGKARGTLVQLATYMDSIGELGTSLKGKEGVIRQIDAKFSTLKGLNPQEFGAGAKSGGLSANAALKGATGLTGETGAYAIAEAKLAQVTHGKIAAVTESTVKTRLAADADALAARKIAESTAAATAASNETVIAKNAEALAARKSAKIKEELAAQELFFGDEEAQANRAITVANRQLAALRERQVQKDAATTYLNDNRQILAVQGAKASIARKQFETAVLQEEMDVASLRATAEAVVQKEKYQRLLAKMTKTVAAENNMSYHLTPGGAGGGKFAGGFGGVNLRQGLRSAVQFGLPSAALYGSVAGIRELIGTANELQVQLGIIKSQFDFATKSGAEFNDISFDQVKAQIIDISKSSLASADVVASVTSQLAAAFSTPDENGVLKPDFKKALGNADDALKLSAVTDLPDQEITDSLTAVQLAFDKTFGSVAEFNDLVTGVSNQFGVLTPELIKFTADLAPLAAEMGFTVQQLTGIAGVAQRASGKSGTQLSEQLSRILAGLKDNAAELMGTLSETQTGQEIATKLAANFAEGDIPAVIGNLSSIYGDLTKHQKETIGALVGGRREAGTFFALLSDNEDLTRVLGDGYGKDFKGSFAEKFAAYSKTMEANVKKLRRTLEEFGLALYNSGIQDGITFLVKGLGAIASVMTKLVEVIGFLNNKLGGMPGEFAVMAGVLAVAIKLWNGLINAKKAYLGLQALGGGAQVLETVGQVVPGGKAGLPGGAGGAGGILGKIGPAFLASGLGKLGTGLGGAGGASTGIGTFAASGGAAAAAFSLVAVLGAAYLAAKAGEAFFNLRKDIDEAGKGLGNTVQEQLDKGVSREEILRRAGTVNPSNTAKLGTWLSGNSNPMDVITDVFQKNDLALNQDFIDRILTDNDDKTKAALDALTGYDIGLTRSDKGGRLQGSDLLKRIKTELEKNPESNYWNNALKELYERFPELKAAADAKVKADAEATEAERQFAENLELKNKALIDYAPTVKQASYDYEHGNISASAYKRVLEGNISRLREQIAAAKNNPDQKQLDELDDNLKKQQDLLNQIEVQPLQIKSFLTGLSGDPVAESKGNVDAAKKAFDILNAPGSGASVQEKIAAAQEVLSAQKEAFDTWVEDATSESEKLRRSQSGYDFDQGALQTLQSYILQADPALQDVAKSSGVDIEQIGTSVANAINGWGKENAETIKAILRAKADAKIALINQQRITNSFLYQDGQDPRENPEGLPGLGRPLSYDEEIAGVNAQYDKNAGTIDSAIAAGKKAPTRGSGNKKENAKKAKELADNLAKARLDFMLAQVENDPVAAARNAQAQADQQYQAAIGSANEEVDKLNAQAARIRADRSLADALFNVQQSRTDLAIAVANAAGDEVEAARLGLDKAKAALAKAQTDGSGDTSQAEAAVVSANAAYRDAGFDKQVDTAEFLHDMESISDSQLITIYQGLISQAKQVGGMDDQIQDWMLKIKGLQDNLGSDFKYNLPTIDLPTLYETRRSDQTPGGSGSYQDNRVISIQLTAANATDAATAAQLIIDELNRPSRFGDTAIKMY